MKVKTNQIYRHFKGDYYIVRDIAIDSETGDEVVVYQALYGNCVLYTRPIKMFLSDVDKVKYPDCTQKERFKLEKIESRRNL